MANGTVSEGKKEACKTYIEQTKLLVTLASAFLFAPPGLVAMLGDEAKAGVHAQLSSFVIAEVLFVLSVLMSYVVLGSLTGSQDKNEFDVFRSATRVSSLLQFGFYVAGLGVFVYFSISLTA